GINHIPVSESAGLTFATQLRALLRQDPDVILVGEIRDADTARIAVQAALAGRLVLTTLHAPNAIGAVYRLFQMGIEPYQVAASLEGVISQRLVRRNCIYCSDSDSVSSPTRSHIQEVLKISKLNLMAGKGCTICRGTGFYDRIGAFQLLEINESIRELISQRPSPTQLDALSRKFGLVSLQEEALSLAAEGLTSVEEVLGLDMDSDE
ncbi:MAG: GspE/PulE family protein, partial [Candidatus Nanopelagicaceae bacterium]